MDGNWQDSVLVEPYLEELLDKRDGNFWAARGKKYAADSDEEMPFWAARGKKGNYMVNGK